MTCSSRTGPTLAVPVLVTLAVLAVGPGIVAAGAPPGPSSAVATGPGPGAEAGLISTGECQHGPATTYMNSITTGPVYPDPGEEVFTRVNVSNDGQSAGQHPVKLYLDGSLHESRTVSVPGCGETSTTFYFSFTEVGNHSIGVNTDVDLHDISVQEPDGDAGRVIVEPLPVDFGNTTVGDEATATVTLTNVGNETVEGLRPVLPTGEAGTRFSVLTESQRTLAPAESWDVEVAFTPGETGRQTAQIPFRNASGDTIANARLVGNGVGPDIAVSPGSLSFTNVGFGQTLNRTVTVSNPGTAPVTVDTLALLGNDGDFTLRTDAGFTLAPGESRGVTVGYEDSGASFPSAGLQVGSGATGVDDEVVPLTTTSATASVDLGQSPDRTWMNAEVQDATAGEPVGVSIPERAGDADASLTGLSVTPSRSGNFSLTATDSDVALSTSPTFKLGDGTTPLDYLSIDHSIDNADVENASLTVTVSKDRLAALNTTAANVSLFRYDGTEWTPQPTAVKRETPEFAVLVATADGLSEWTAAARRPRFNVSDTETSIDAGVVGDEVTIRVFVVNTGGADGVYEAKLLLNGEVVDRQEATVPDGGKRALNFERSFDEPGDYEVRVNDVFVGRVDISAEDEDVDVGTTTGDGAVGDGGDGPVGDGDDGSDGSAGDGADGTNDGDEADEGGGIPLPAIVLIVGALALVAAYVRYSGRPPGTGPGPPPEPRSQQGPQGGAGGGGQAGQQGGGAGGQTGGAGGGGQAGPQGGRGGE